MKILSVFALFVTFCISSQVFAFEHDGACKADVEKFCKDVKPGGKRIAKCLREHKDELTDTCKAKKEKMKEKFHDFKKACKEDIKTKCAGVRKGRGRVIECLKENKASLSSECQEAMEHKKD